jgi:hypothetical protein
LRTLPECGSDPATMPYCKEEERRSGGLEGDVDGRRAIWLIGEWCRGMCVTVEAEADADADVEPEERRECPWVVSRW